MIKKSLQQLIQDNKENIMRDKKQLGVIERNLEQKHTDSQKGDA
ncbi:FbpB family small basic protein [Bacillus sp. V3]|nr:FbpB family small basic protein [[Bacillus] enclensis]MBH9965203.1 FbpB family small basic protein [[Bacillus] enclensis]QTC42641.1 FbpB family small basic protein [Bacillus sp. V3]QWC24737.1 FbpB family small basic protein [Bacillus haikouensis]